jgi:hypothetical protein
MALYRFDDMLQYSRGVREQTDALTIQAIIAGCVSVEKSGLVQDKNGVDYIATLRNGARVLIDAKTRQPGCSKYWRNGPELALERWSVMPGGRYGIPATQSRVGWTLCERKEVDYILFTFPPADAGEVFLYPYQSLRMTFRRMFSQCWARYKHDTQDSGSWESECVFVPEATVWQAMRESVRFSAAAD